MVTVALVEGFFSSGSAEMMEGEGPLNFLIFGLSPMPLDEWRWHEFIEIGCGSFCGKIDLEERGKLLWEILHGLERE